MMMMMGTAAPTREATATTKVGLKRAVVHSSRRMSLMMMMITAMAMLVMTPTMALPAQSSTVVTEPTTTVAGPTTRQTMVGRTKHLRKGRLMTRSDVSKGSSQLLSSSKSMTPNHTSNHNHSNSNNNKENHRILEEQGYDYDGDDDAVDDDFGDDEGDWDAEKYNNKNDDLEGDDGGYDDVVRNYEKKAANNTVNMFDTAPHQWSATQWAIFAGMLTLFGICFFCCCVVFIIPRCCGQRGTMIYSAMI